jgi:hypothetical protein
MRPAKAKDKFYEIVGTEVTFACDLGDWGGHYVEKKGDTAVIQEALITPGHWHSQCPDIWVEEELILVKLKNKIAHYKPDVFEELKPLLKTR